MTAVSQAPSGVRALAADRRLQIAIIVLCLLGIGDAGYLTYVHYSGIKVACLSSGGCETVQASQWAKLAGIPVALLGLIGYISILLSLLVRGELGRAAADDHHRVALPARPRPEPVNLATVVPSAHLGHWYVQLAFAAPALAIIGYIMRDSLRRRLRERRAARAQPQRPRKGR